MSVIFSATPATSIIINTTAITGGTDTRVLFDDGGFIGEDAGFTYTKTTRALAITSGSVLITSPANTSPLVISGYSLTGSDSHPMFDLSGTVNASGTPTVIKLTVTDTQACGLIDLRTTSNGSMFYVGNDGTGYFFSNIQAANGGINISNTGYFNWAGRTNFRSSADGDVVFANNAETSFGLLKFGGTSSSFPAVKRASAVLEHRLADDSAYGDAKALHFITTATDFMCKTVGTLANGAGAATGTLLNAPAAGNPTKWVPLDDNGTTRYIPAW